jgi:transketolase
MPLDSVTGSSERRARMVYDRELIRRLERKANELRQDVIRMTHAAGSGHPGGSLGAADLIAALYFHVLRVDPDNPRWPDRDRFVLSKGHACPVLYAALAHRGFFPRRHLATLRQTGSILQGHPDMLKTPGLDTTSGSLGNGLAVGLGMALSGRLDGDGFRVYVMLGDGDCQEGCTWEAAMKAAHERLANLTAIFDYNQSQVDGRTWDIVDLEPAAEKWRAFNWAVREIDGHSMTEIVDAFDWATGVDERPTLILAHTIKGEGVSFMVEDPVTWHGKAPNTEQAERALNELNEVGR